MEYAKDEVFSIYYNEKKDRLEYSLFRRIMNKVLNNKFITLLITLGVLFSVLNFTLIYFFFKILSNL